MQQCVNTNPMDNISHRNKTNCYLKHTSERHFKLLQKPQEVTLQTKISAQNGSLHEMT